MNEYATHSIVDQLQRIFPSIELRLYHYFSKELLTYTLENEVNDRTQAVAGHQSRSFIAFEFGKTSTMLKAYFFAVFKARETDQSTQTLISRAIAKLADIVVLLPAQSGTSENDLPHKAHRTAGILYYYDMRPRQLVPTPRLYIPVRKYGRSGTVIAEGLLTYLKTRGRDEMTGRYLKVLRSA